MNNEELKKKILSILPIAELIENPQFLSFNIPSDGFYKLAKSLKESDDLAFNFLFCLTGMDYGDSLGVVYHLSSTKYGHEIVLKVSAGNRETPAIDTVCDIWRTAEFHEREVFDLFGIKFNNHPDLRRLFLEENWVGHPLRKDYIDEVNIVER